MCPLQEKFLMFIRPAEPLRIKCFADLGGAIKIRATKC